jgi:hypothetical protein
MEHALYCYAVLTRMSKYCRIYQTQDVRPCKGLGPLSRSLMHLGLNRQALYAPYLELSFGEPRSITKAPGPPKLVPYHPLGPEKEPRYKCLSKAEILLSTLSRNSQ